ncbi:hypothetical protein GALL_537920 [mine drainage metagenome]|uniref:Uncharacterized protein n=1 Tax=mine drainage metagenome TaxID=410659 RepID=A0A1J5P212_9ZZZZ
MLLKLLLITILSSALMASDPKIFLHKNELKIVGNKNNVVLLLPKSDINEFKYYSVSQQTSNRYTIFVWAIKSYKTDMDDVNRIELIGRSIDFIDKQDYGGNFENSFQVALYGGIKCTNNMINIKIKEIIGITKIKGNETAILKAITIQ